MMTESYPGSWTALKQPWQRRDLLIYLEELASSDPIAIWEEERRNGLVSGFDQVIHFFFDDTVLDRGGIGFSLFDSEEVELIARLKEPLDTICDETSTCPTDNEAVRHPLWKEVRQRAAMALERMVEAKADPGSGPG